MPSRKITLEKDFYYHIYNRGFDKNIIFKSCDDFDRFIKTIVRYNKEYIGIKLTAYCLLPNHFHFILKSINSGQEISDFMRKIQQSYVRYFKTQYPDISKKGQMFEGRFNAKQIGSEKYFYQCLAYVSFNALKHGIVDDINDYPYTSYHQLTNKKKIDGYKDLVLEELEL